MIAPVLALAQETQDSPDLTVVSVGHGKVRLQVTAGPGGAPAGFTVTWMRAEDFAANGGTWPDNTSDLAPHVSFTGVATLHTWGEAERSFQLESNESLDTEIGDLADETGVSGTTVGELAGGLEYVFRVCANGTAEAGASAPSTTRSTITTVQGLDCTYTQGYWKTHPAAWPVTDLVLGSVSYTKSQLLYLLIAWSVKGNGLVSLAHQLIAAKLNVANGSNPLAAADAITAADDAIGSLVVPPIGTGYLPPSDTSELTQTLDDFNNGVTGPGHCGTVPTSTTSWGRLKGLYR